VNKLLFFLHDDWDALRVELARSLSDDNVETKKGWLRRLIGPLAGDTSKPAETLQVVAENLTDRI
jgi:hypothetical protein